MESNIENYNEHIKFLRIYRSYVQVERDIVKERDIKNYEKALM